MKYKKFYQQTILQAPFGYAHYEIIPDEAGKTCDFRFTEVNEAYEKLTGLCKESIIDKTVRQVFPDAGISCSGWRSLFDRIAIENGIAGFEHHIAETGGRLLVNAWHTDATHIAITFNELTACRQEAEPRCMNETQQQAFWANSLFGVLIADKNANYVDANDEACRMTGYSCAELKSMNIYQLIDPRQTEEAHTHFEQLCKTGRAYGEVAYYTKSGEKRWWNVVATKISEDLYLGFHEDITGRKLVEEQLRENEEHHAKVISNINDVLWEYEVDSAGNFVRSYISPVADRMLGLPQGTIGQKFENSLKFTHPDDIKKVQDAMSSSLFSDEPRVHSIDYRVITNDGSMKYLRSSGIVHVKQNGNRLAYGTTSDITGLKNKEEELLKAKANLTAIVENTLDSIWAINTNYEVIYLNDNFKQGYLTAFNLTLQPGSNKLQALPEAMIPVWKERYDKVLGGERIEFIETVDVPGMTLYIEVAGNPIIQDGSVIGASFFGRDITERKCAEKALADSTHRFHLVVENMSDGIWLMDLALNTIWISPSVSRLRGYTLEEIQALPMASQFTPESARLVAEAIAEELTPERLADSSLKILRTMELGFLCKDGTVLWTESTYSIIRDTNGKPQAVLGVGHDITGRKRADEALRVREDHLQKQNGALLALMSRGTLFQSNLQQAIAEITEVSSMFVGTERVSVWVYDEDYSEIRCIDVYNRSAHLHSNKREILRCGEFPTYFDCQKKGEVIAAADVYADPRTCELPAAYYKEHNIRSMLDTPVWFHNRLGAILCFEHVGEQRLWTSEDVRLATSMAALLSLCFQNEERKLAERERESAMLMLQSALAQSPSGILIADAPDVTIRWANEAALTIRGRSDVALTGIDVSKHSVSWQTFRLDGTHMPSEELPLSRAILKGETVRNEEVIIRHASGEDRYVSANSAPIRNSAGEITAGIVVFHDITERKKTEQKLFISQETTSNLNTLLNAILESPQDVVVFALDTNYCYSAFTKAHKLVMRNLWGVDIKVGDNMLDYINLKEDRNKAYNNFKRCLSGDSFILEEEYGDSSLQRSYYETRYSPLLNEHKQIIGLTVFNIDITDRRQAEEVLKTERMRLAGIIEGTHIGTWEWNVQTGETVFNERWADIIGYTLEEISPVSIKTWMKFAHPDDLKLSGELLEKHFNGELDYYEFESRMRHKNGEWIWVLDRGKVISWSDEGKPVIMLGTHQDITERKRAEEELQIKNRAIESSLNAIAIADLSGNLTYVNASFLKLWGYKDNNEVIGRPVVDFWQNSEKTYIVIEELHNQGYWMGEMKALRSDGSLFDADGSASLIKNQQGTPLCMQASFIDITERKLAEQQLRASEKKYQELSTLLRLLADNMPDMLWAKNLNKEYIFANKAICRNLLNAIDTEEPLGKNDMFFAMRERNSQPENPGWHTFGEICSDSDSITLKEMKPMQFDEFGNVKGKFLFLDVHKAPLFDDKGQLIGVVGSARDVTAAREAENQLRKLSQAVEQSPASVVITDLYGTIEYVNPKFTEITGYLPDEAIGQNPRILKSGEIPAAVYTDLWKTISFGKDWKGEFHNKKKNGEFFWESAHISPIKNDNGEILHYLAVKEDITERKTLEERLKHQTHLRELLMKISSGFINIPLEKVNESVNDALGEMALFVNADRAYTFDYDWEKDVCKNIYEWCAEGISAEINNLQLVPLAMMQDWVEAHRKGEPMYVPDVFRLPYGAVREILEPQGIKSVLSVPMMNENQCIGFVGFDSVQKHHEYTNTEVQLLKVFAQLLVNVKLRKEIVEQLVAAKVKAEESDEKHRTLIEQMLEGLVVNDDKGNIRFVNPMFCKMTGYQEHELIGKSAYELLLKKDDLGKIRLKDEERRKNISDQYELDVITKSGEIRTFWFHATPVIDKEGVVTGSMSTVTDITERKRDQEKIRITKDTYESVFNAISEAIYVHDENGLFIDVNHGAEKMYGYTRNELLGKNPAEVSAPGMNDLAVVQKIIQEVSASGISQSLEFWGQRKSGDIFPKEVIVNRGKYFGKDHIIVTARDITERKRTETARKIQYNIARSIHTAKKTADLLETIRQELGQLFDTTNFFVARYDREKDTLKQLIFRDEMDSFDEWDAKQSISGQVVKSGKTVFLRGDELDTFSRQHNLEVMGTDSACWLGVPVFSSNHVIGVMVIQHYSNPDAYNDADVALFEMVAHEAGIYLEKQKMIEDLIVAKNKAEESDRLKTAFMNNISHEMRTPLNGILGFGELMMDKSLSWPDKLNHYQILQKSSYRLLQTVTDILDISEIRANTLELTISNVDIMLILNELLKETIQACANKNILVTLQTPEHSKKMIVRTDKNLFKKVIRHLLNNAEKFTDQGRITFGFELSSDIITFFVKDTGKGIEPDNLALIFEPFMQEDVSITRGHEGSGLGLSIARGMLNLLGGKIWVKSEKNKGSEFYFTLPLNAAKSETESNQWSESGKRSVNPLILIVEDELSNYLYFNEIIKKKGYKTLHAFNGAEAVSLCHQYPEITLIIMDMKMPVMNGLEATMRIREFRQNIPVVAITAYTQSNDRHQAILAGCNDYLSKPVKPRDFLQTISRFL